MKGLDDDRTMLGALRELPAEVSVEQVDRMVAAFPLAVGITAWLVNAIKFNLNSVLMTTTGSIIVGTSAYLFHAGPPTAVPAALDLPEPTRMELVAPPVADTPVEPAVVLTIPGKKDPRPPQERKEPDAMACMVRTEAGTTDGATDEEAAYIYEGADAYPGATPYHGAQPATPAAPNEPWAHVDHGRPAVVFRPGPALKTFDLKDFDALAVHGPLNVELAPGPFSVSASGDQELLDHLKPTVRNGTLDLELSEGKDSRKDNMDGTLSITVRMPHVKALHVFGSGTLTSAAFERADRLSLSVMGSGDIIFEGIGEVTDLELSLKGSGDILCGHSTVQDATRVDIAGSGDVRVEGSSGTVDISIAGSGDVVAGGLKARKANVRIAGSGDVEVNSAEGVETSITGSGKVNDIGSAGNDRSRGVGNEDR